MARRRVLRTRAKCPGLVEDLGPTAKQKQFVGLSVELQKASESDVNVLLNGTVVGRLDERISEQVVTALDRGQVFTAVVEKAFPIYNEQNWKQDGAYLDLKIEYMLEKGYPRIEYPKDDSPVQAVPTSFYTKVVGSRTKVVSGSSLDAL